ncbi:MAG: TonB-dependent receptor plug domain-containing protein [Nitrospirae bacterium]|nr:TonB-dependent receptor plug domain-containing protein [Nitrospirota bacterium]
MRRPDMRLSFMSLAIVVMLGGEAEIRSVALAQDRTISVTETEKRQREQELRRQVKKIQDELRALDKEPAGVTKSVVPRSELSDQPTRNLRESLESVPGMSVRQGAGGRDVNLSIRGSGK